MSVLDKLIIRGVRSFGPNEDEKIKFSTPLTLFLGQNGCGKTTIIECVKYALTGDFPSGTESGRGFVNDPKMTNKSSTKACVKLKFRDSKGDYITVGKFMEVSTLKEGKLKFKSMAPSIRWENKEGQIEDISGRCTDIDFYCAQKLNVSKAIINNVIFCHQENSAWPLEEAKKLKEKFDEIFGATEYNKCVERLRKLLKEKRINIKVLNEQFEQKKMAKKITEGLKQKLNSNEEKLNMIIKEIEQKDKEIEPLQNRLDEINILIDNINELSQKLTGLKKTLEGVHEHQAALKKHLVKEYEGTDEQLGKEISNFGNFQNETEKTISAMEEKKDTVSKALRELSNQLQSFQVTFGKLKEEENQNLKRIEEINELIEKAKLEMKVSMEDNVPVSELLQSLKSAVKDEELDFNIFKRGLENDEKQLQEVIDSVRDKFVSARENMSSKSKMIDEITRKTKDAKLKLSRLEISNSQITIISDKIKEAEEMLVKKRNEFDEDAEQQKLEELESEILEKEQLQNKLDRENRILLQNCITEQNIKREETSINEKKCELNVLKQKHQQHFDIIFHGTLPQDNIEQAVRKIQKQEDNKVKTINQNINDFEKKVTSLESTYKYTKENLMKCREEVTQNKKTVESVCKGKQFSDVLNQTYIKKEKLQKDKGTYRSAKILYEQFINQFEEDIPCCPVCETDFTSKKGVVLGIIKNLRSKIEEIPKKLASTENELKKEEEFYNKLQQLKPVNDNVQMIEETKIPLLEDELQQISEKLDETRMELISLKNEVKEPQTLVESCRAVISDVALFDRLVSDIKKSEGNMGNLKKELVQVPSKRTLDESETELKKLKAEIMNLRSQLKTGRDLFNDTKRSIQTLNGKLQNEIQKKLEVEKQVQEQPLLKKQIEEYKTVVVELEAEKTKLKETISSLEKELGKAEKNRNEVIAKNKKMLEEKRSEVETHKRLVDEIQKLNQTVERYENGGSKTKLENVLKQLDEGKVKMGQMENAMKILNEKIMENKAELANQESKLRALKDNMDLRNSRKKSQEIEDQVNDLRKQIGNHNSRSICQERSKVIEKVDLKQNEKSIKTGEKISIEQQIKENQKELSKKEHREAINEFKKKYYEKRIEELEIEDLNLYTVALETSILKFHKERMVQINMFIRELWRSIYKGNDIDYIEIKTEDSFGPGGGVKRSYNYKVVQVKKGVELEMRGRCSAGQRVLACLVIRMALAETFSSNCGILALDEPTTNLDKDNIMSLSDALSKIITEKSKQKSFQLLVITHDEEFLQTLTRDQSVSHYFRVQRNADGFSEIKKEVL